MSSLSEAPSGSNDLNAPTIPDWLHYWEKVFLTGTVVSAILYGVVIVLFFQCMSALLYPVDRTREGIKWKFVAHTVAMFLFATIYTAATLNLLSSSFVDHRDYPGTTRVPPGPAGYMWFSRSKPIGITPPTMILINKWLADGLLLYRCCIVYSMSYWLIVLPCIMYLACLATGIMFVYQLSQPDGIAVVNNALVHYGAPYFSVTFSLNVLLTLMIVTKLILHRKKIRISMGATAGVSKLYKAAVTILVESCALYVVTFLLFVGGCASGSILQYFFLQIFAQTQVIAPFLIILQVAKQRPLTNDTIVSRNVRTSGQGKPPGRSETIPSVYSAQSMDVIEIGFGAETTVNLPGGKDSGTEGSSEV